MSEHVWKKPVICIFKERDVNPEVDPFVVVKAKTLMLTQGNDKKFNGKIEDFFTLMGDSDYLSSTEGQKDHYVMCWFDDTEPDTTRDLRRLRGVTFNNDVACAENDKTGKRTYNGTFKADYGKIK